MNTETVATDDSLPQHFIDAYYSLSPEGRAEMDRLALEILAEQKDSREEQS